MQRHIALQKVGFNPLITKNNEPYQKLDIHLSYYKDNKVNDMDSLEMCSFILDNAEYNIKHTEDLWIFWQGIYNKFKNNEEVNITKEEILKNLPKNISDDFAENFSDLSVSITEFKTYNTGYKKIGIV